MTHDQHDDTQPGRYTLFESLVLLPEAFSLEDLLALLPEGAGLEDLPALMPDGLSGGGLLDWEAARRQWRMRLEAKINGDVQEYGFFVMVVVDPARAQPPFAYTIGLHHTNPALCDLLMLGLDAERLWHFVADIARGALADKRCEAGQTSAEFTANGLPFFFAPVGAEYYDDYLGWASNFYARRPFPVLQVVWPDEAGRFPWQSGFDERFRAQQPLLFESSPYTGGPAASPGNGAV